MPLKLHHCRTLCKRTVVSEMCAGCKEAIDVDVRYMHKFYLGKDPSHLQSTSGFPCQHPNTTYYPVVLYCDSCAAGIILWMGCAPYQA